MELEQSLPFHTIDDLVFVNEIINNNPNYPLSVLNTLTFNNSDIIGRTCHTLNHLNDPELDEPICEYIFSDESQNQMFPHDSLKILSYNISSVPQHLESLHDQCLSSFNVASDVIGLCETRLNDNICNFYQLENYSSFFS